MEQFYSLMFYILAFIILALAITAIIIPKPLYSVVCAIGVFWSIAAMYFLLNSEFNAVAQLAIYGVGVGILLIFTLMLTEGEKYKILPVKPSVIIALIFAFLIFVCGKFYISDAFGRANLRIVQNVSFETFGVEMLVKYFFSFELVSILLLSAIVGIAAIIKMKGKNNDC